MSSAMDSLMSTVDTITSADSDDPSCHVSCAPIDSPAGFVAKSPPPSPKDSKLASAGVSTTPAAGPPPGPPPLPGGAASSLLTAISASSAGSKKLQSSPTHTASSLKTRSFDGLLGHPLDATSTTTTVSTTSSARGSTSDENAFLFLGCVQALLGILMAVFGVLAMLHHASMASSGAGIWGGAVGFVSGVVGVIAGLRSCYSSSLRGGSRSGRPPIAPTAFMALSLVTLATANLVLVLAAIGLVRDARTPDIQLLGEQQDGEEPSDEPVSSPGSSHWERVLASCGLLLASGLQLLAAIASGYRCYRLVCPCAARKHSPLYNQRSSGLGSGSPDSLHSGLYSSGSKERLVSRWLTRQVPNGPVYTGSPTPSGLLLFSTQPPPPVRRDARAPGFTSSSPGHHAQTVYTLTQPPSPMPGPNLIPAGMPTYPGGMGNMSYYTHFMNPVVGRPRVRYHPRQHRHQHLPTLPSDERLRRDRRSRGHRDRGDQLDRQRRERREAKPKPVTEADVARTYTGLDRRIAEEFIMAMDHGRPPRPHDAE